MSDENKIQPNSQTDEQQDLPAKPLDEQSETADEESLEAEKPGASKLPLLVSLFLALVALLIASSVAWLGHDKSQQLEVQIGQMQEALESKPSQDQVQQLTKHLESLTELEARQEQQAASLASYQEAVQKHQQQFQELHADLLKASEPRPRDWQLAEVEYLLRLASQRLQLEEDVAGALTLFKTAEQRLKAAEVPGTLAVRQSLQNDIAKLEALPVLDRVSLALDLQRLADQVLSLQIQPLQEAPSFDLDAAASQESSQAWYLSLWQEIKSLVVIRHRDLPLEALPFTEEELALRHQISSLLQQASWAALRARESMYQQSLQGAVSRLEVFDLADSKNKSFVNQVSELQAKEVELNLPSVDGSLDRLQSFIAERYGRPLPLMEESNPDADATSGQAEETE